MSHILLKHPLLVAAAALGATALVFAAPSSQQSAPPSAESSGTKIPIYFPPGAVDSFGSFFSSYLGSFGEPSLLAAAQDPSALSYRLNWLSAQHGYVLAIRISMNPDGSGRITTVEQPPSAARLQRTQLDVSSADGNKFLQMVERARFWSMPAVEQQDPEPGHRVYKMDASSWAFEGVRKGSYHVVFRQGLDPGPFKEMVRFLANGLAKLNRPLARASR
jgi:hypothetical protein